MSFVLQQYQPNYVSALELLSAKKGLYSSAVAIEQLDPFIALFIDIKLHKGEETVHLP